MPSAVELAKLKVAELKDLLKEKDLPTAGVKQELIDRLLAAEGGATAEPAAQPTPSVEPATKPAAGKPVETSASTAKSASAAKPADAKPSEPAAKVAESPAVDAAGAPEGETEEERRKRRAARFGVPLVEPKAAPAKAAPAKAAPAKAAPSEKVLARQERFGKVETEGKPADNKRKERTTPAAPAPELSEEMKAKLEARAKRFAASGGAS